MSVIHGQGHGSRHDWEIEDTLKWIELGLKPGAAQTAYRCRQCGAYFTHYYHLEPDIFLAMKDHGVPDECTVSKED